MSEDREFDILREFDNIKCSLSLATVQVLPAKDHGPISISYRNLPISRTEESSCNVVSLYLLFSFQRSANIHFFPSNSARQWFLYQSYHVCFGIVMTGTYHLITRPPWAIQVDDPLAILHDSIFLFSGVSHYSRNSLEGNDKPAFCISYPARKKRAWFAIFFKFY